LPFALFASAAGFVQADPPNLGSSLEMRRPLPLRQKKLLPTQQNNVRKLNVLSL
jgi:hypothetical protein